MLTEMEGKGHLGSREPKSKNREREGGTCLRDTMTQHGVCKHGVCM